MGRTVELPIEKFLGINRRDSGRNILLNEFFTLQNWFHLQNGTLAKRGGSIFDITPSDVPGSNRITGLHRNVAAPSPKAILYHVTPNNDVLTHPDGTGLVLTEVVAPGGEIFSTTPLTDLSFCHSYIGMGVESTWDTRLRAGFVPFTGTPILAEDQPGLQVISLAAVSNKVDVTHPGAFPTNVRAVNVFMAIGNSASQSANVRELTYVGTLNSPSDTLDIDFHIGREATFDDAIDSLDSSLAEARSEVDGKIPPGQYFVSLAWISDTNDPYDETTTFISNTNLSAGIAVEVSGQNNAIAIGLNTSNRRSANNNGATHCYVFFGTQPSAKAPMMFVGILKPGLGTNPPVTGFGGGFVIKEVPVNRNAQGRANFNARPIKNQNENKVRSAFIVKRDPDLTPEISEVFQERTSNSLGLFIPIRSDNDKFFNGNSLPDPVTLIDPSFVSFFGNTFMVNGFDQIKITNGMTFGVILPAPGAALVRPPKFMFAFKSQLVAITNEDNSLLFGSNALTFDNWSEGAVGTALKFVAIGNTTDRELTALGIFSFTTGNEGPNTFILAFKKNALHSISNIPDLLAGINATSEQLSGEVGCLAFRTVVNSNTGVYFLGSDGDIYIVRGAGEPIPVGRKIKPLFEHLVEDDNLMLKCTATVTKDFLRISYPSKSTSTENDAQVFGDIRSRDRTIIKWSGPHIGISVGPQIIIRGQGDDGRRIAALGDQMGSAIIDQKSTFQDLGVTMTSLVESNLIRVATASRKKRIMGANLDVLFDSGFDHTLIVDFLADYEFQRVEKILSSGGGVWDVSNWNQANWADEIFRLESFLLSDTNLIGNFFKFKITHQDNAQFILAAVNLLLQQEKRNTQ